DPTSSDSEISKDINSRLINESNAPQDTLPECVGEGRIQYKMISGEDNTYDKNQGGSPKKKKTIPKPASHKVTKTKTGELFAPKTLKDIVKVWQDAVVSFN